MPAAHCVHVVELGAPTAVEYRPTPHATHSVATALGWYWPAGQSLQVPAGGTKNLPGVHVLQSMAPTGGALPTANAPPPQCRQDDSPGMFWNKPEAQAVQARAPSAAYMPTAHSVHWPAPEAE